MAGQRSGGMLAGSTFDNSQVRIEQMSDKVYPDEAPDSGTLFLTNIS